MAKKVSSQKKSAQKKSTTKTVAKKSNKKVAAKRGKAPVKKTSAKKQTKKVITKKPAKKSVIRNRISSIRSMKWAKASTDFQRRDSRMPSCTPHIKKVRNTCLRIGRTLIQLSIYIQRKARRLLCISRKLIKP